MLILLDGSTDWKRIVELTAGIDKPVIVAVDSPEDLEGGTFTVDNTAGAALMSSLAFSDPLPAGVVIATPNGASNGCGGTLTATAGTTTISYSGGSVNAGASCTVAVDVESSTLGTHLNTSDDLTFDGGNIGFTAEVEAVAGDDDRAPHRRAGPGRQRAGVGDEPGPGVGGPGPGVLGGMLVAAGTPMAYRISVAEGVTSWQVVDALQKAEFLTGEIAGRLLELTGVYGRRV